MMKNVLPFLSFSPGSFTDCALIRPLKILKLLSNMINELSFSNKYCGHYSLLVVFDL